ncbi:hypothetical protein BAE44_0024254 [Dichanthelium oligosanthes]|uniref:Uncharacterized protein n=1 Tax=Dichanthelium oligosanthes TaxID=888268 RepID=A0A1E5UPD3_9POAL|nr:hypothetical protein BAE44_0024254 [Dichanthelium oligosanthes]
MELPPAASFVAVVLPTVLFLTAILRLWKPKCRYNLPPGPRPWPVIGNLNLIGTLPHRSVHELSKRMATGRYILDNYSDVLWAPYGAYWRQARKLWKTEILSARRLRSHEHVRYEEVRVMLRDLYDEHGPSSTWRTVVLMDHLLMVNLNVISRMVLGKEYVGHGGKGSATTTPEEFKWMMDELFFLSGAFNIGDMIPWLSWLDPHAHQED